MTQVNKLDPALGQALLFNDEQNAVRRMEYFVVVTVKPETTRTSELNSWNKENLHRIAEIRAYLVETKPFEIDNPQHHYQIA